MGLFDSLFGGESDKGIKLQREQNNQAQQLIEENTAVGRADIQDIIPRGIENLQQGYRSAIDVASRSPQAAIRALNVAGVRGQEALLGGQAAFQNAIMGLPTGIDTNNMYNNPFGLTPVKATEAAAPELAFTQSERPLFLGTREQDVMQDAIRRNPDAVANAIATDPAVARQAAAMFPERFRQSPRVLTTAPAQPSSSGFDYTSIANSF